MSNKKNSISAKGYYIALILCAVAIGISGYLYYRNANDTPDDLAGRPDMSVDATAGADVQAIATQPSSGEDKPGTTTPTSGKKLQTASPVAGKTVSEYAMATLSYNQTTRDWRTHNGIDIAAEAGTKVCAAAAGEVYTVFDDDIMGTTVVVRHEGGYMTTYSSLAEEVSVEPGDKVALGQAIGCVGNTALLENAIGDHVHFSVTCNDAPVDPADFLAAA